MIFVDNMRIPGEWIHSTGKPVGEALNTIGYRGGEKATTERGFRIPITPENAVMMRYLAGPTPRPMACLGPVDHAARIRKGIA